MSILSPGGAKRGRAQSVVVLALLATALVPSAGLAQGEANPACTDTEFIEPGRFDSSPWPAPARNPGGAPLLVGVAIDQFPTTDRLGLRIEVTDESGLPVPTTPITKTSEGRRWTEIDVDRRQARGYRATLTETWDDLLDGPCTTTVIRDFVAGGPPIRFGPQPRLRVDAKLNRGRRSVGGIAYDNEDFGATLRLRVVGRCRVVSDGSGNGVFAPRAFFVSVVGAGHTEYGDPCPVGPTPRRIGSTPSFAMTFRVPLRVGLDDPSRSAFDWRVGYTNARGGFIDGSVRYALTERRPERFRRIFETDFDAYFNICLRQRREVFASGGLLYCTVRVARAQARVRLTAAAR